MLKNGIPINKTNNNSTIMNKPENLYTSPLDKYSLLPKSIAANGDAAGVAHAEDNTAKIIREMIGAGLMPAVLQNVKITGCMIIPITRELEIFVNTIHTTITTTVNTVVDIPLKIGPIIVFKRIVIPVDWSVNTFPK